MQEETLDETALETSQEPEVVDEEPSDSVQEEPQHEEVVEKPRLYADKYKTPEELEVAYRNSNVSATKLAQRVRELEKQNLDPEAKEILGQLKSLGVVTRDELEEQEYINQLVASDNAAIASLNLTDSQERVLRNYSRLPENLGRDMRECWSELSSGIEGGKVISRKTTIKPRSGSKGGGFKPLSQAELSRMPDDQYNKYWKDYEAAQNKS